VEEEEPEAVQTEEGTRQVALTSGYESILDVLPALVSATAAVTAGQGEPKPSRRRRRADDVTGSVSQCRPVAQCHRAVLAVRAPAARGRFDGLDGSCRLGLRQRADGVVLRLDADRAAGPPRLAHPHRASQRDLRMDRPSTTRSAGAPRWATSAPSSTNAFTPAPTPRHDHPTITVRNTGDRSQVPTNPRAFRRLVALLRRELSSPSGALRRLRLEERGHGGEQCEGWFSVRGVQDVTVHSEVTDGGGRPDDHLLRRPGILVPLRSQRGVAYRYGAYWTRQPRLRHPGRPRSRRPPWSTASTGSAVSRDAAEQTRMGQSRGADQGASNPRPTNPRRIPVGGGPCCPGAQCRLRRGGRRTSRGGPSVWDQHRRSSPPPRADWCYGAPRSLPSARRQISCLWGAGLRLVLSAQRIYRPSRRDSGGPTLKATTCATVHQARRKDAASGSGRAPSCSRRVRLDDHRLETSAPGSTHQRADRATSAGSTSRCVRWSPLWPGRVTLHGAVGVDTHGTDRRDVGQDLARDVAVRDRQRRRVKGIRLTCGFQHRRSTLSGSVARVWCWPGTRGPP
jgi:hypothetical protein